MSEDSRRLFIFECKTKSEATILAKQFESKYTPARNKYSTKLEVNIDLKPTHCLVWLSNQINCSLQTKHLKLE